jgi:hypothetical protein
MESAENLRSVERFEADSKFFRSFAVVLLVLPFIWRPLGWPWPPLAAVPAVLVLALWRYMEQRLKATNQAY